MDGTPGSEDGGARRAEFVLLYLILSAVLSVAAGIAIFSVVSGLLVFVFSVLAVVSRWIAHVLSTRSLRRVGFRIPHLIVFLGLLLVSGLILPEGISKSVWNGVTIIADERFTPVGWLYFLAAGLPSLIACEVAWFLARRYIARTEKS